jgi:hypothetical protein
MERKFGAELLIPHGDPSILLSRLKKGSWAK